MPNGGIVFYLPALLGGGAERVWALVAAGLHARGHDVTFAVDFEAEHNAGLLPADMKRVVLGRSHGAAVRALARYLRAEKPAVVFAGVGASNGKLLAAKTLARWKGAAVISAHGRLDAEGRFLGRTIYRASALTSRLAARMITVSEDLRTYLIRRFKARADRVVTIHNAVYLPPASAVPAREALAARDDVVLAVARLVPEKGLNILIEAIARSTRQPRLVVLGEGPEREALEALAAKLGVADRVELRGYMKEPWPAYAEAKMLALSSLTEAFGNVIVEALGYGLPVVATACGGPDEVLDHGRYGRLVPPGDAAALAAAIDATLADPGEPAEARRRAEDFSIDRALDRFEALIAEVTGR